MLVLENSDYKIGILAHGAELRSVINKATNREYIWQADASVWNRSSPVLFPFVGRLKDDKYLYKGKTYHLPQHGFARNCNFDVIEHSSSKLILELKANDESLMNYPFQFKLKLIYVLQENALALSYRVENTGDEELFFSIGAHPAFVLDEDLEQYFIQFEEEERFNRHLLDAGLINHHQEPVFMQKNVLKLRKEYFEQDAIVIKDMQSSTLSLVNHQGKKIVSLSADQFPYYGIWSKAPYPFICFEPWEGVADAVDSTGELTQKEGILQLLSSEVFLRGITFRFF